MADDFEQSVFPTLCVVPPRVEPPVLTVCVLGAEVFAGGQPGAEIVDGIDV